MSSGIYNIRSKGNLLNCYEFEWDPQKESKLYVIVSTIMCVMYLQWWSDENKKL